MGDIEAHGMTGIPMNRVTVADAPTPKPAMRSVVAEPSAQDGGPPEDWPDISVLQGNRLQITANVDALRMREATPEEDGPTRPGAIVARGRAPFAFQAGRDFERLDNDRAIATLLSQMEKPAI
jgi:hypothetical protein